MMGKKSYSEKLKDPRWQKKRLEILNRDNWCCQKCYDAENTLHVHHMRYIAGRDPWDYDSNLLVTLCAECHEHEKEARPCNESDLLEMLKEQGFMADDLHSIANGIHLMNSHHPPEVTATIIEYALSDARIWKKICKAFFADLEELAKQS